MSQRVHGRQLASRKGLARDKRPSTIGGVLRNLRVRNHWTLKEMSRQIAIPVSTLSKVENGHLTLTYDKLVELHLVIICRRFPNGNTVAARETEYLQKRSLRKC